MFNKVIKLIDFLLQNENYSKNTEAVVQYIRCQLRQNSNPSIHSVRQEHNVIVSE